MKIAIAYCSSHGTTEKVSKTIAEQIIGHEVQLINLDKNTYPNIEPYDLVVIGGSIYGGNIQKRVKKFCAKNMESLLQKKIGLFICCMNKDKQQDFFENAFPEQLRSHSTANACAGGELILEKLNFFEKLMVRVASNTTESTSQLDYDAIDKFVSKLI